jgi:Flp pilus assembly pilin Flp
MNQLLVRAFLALSREEEGQTLLEYAIIISLVSVSAIALLETIATFAPGVFNQVAGDL